MSDLHYLGLVEAGRRLAARELSSVELTTAMLARIDALDPRLRAFVTVTPERALRQAERADAALAARRRRVDERARPLLGVPVAVKDLCFTKGVTTTAGMPLNAAFKPRYDATVVRRMDDAGSVLLGKLQMTEGAFSHHHPEVAAPQNPWGAHLYAGVSSSGSGVATAAGLCFGSLGSDTGGSIRFPSAVHGLTGLKPTWGRVSRHGVFDLAPSLDHVGPMCRSAADCAAVLGAIAGADEDDPTAALAPVPDYLATLERRLRGLRVGVDPALNDAAVDAATGAALRDAARALEARGAEVRELTLPDSSAVASEWVRYCAVEAAVVHADNYPRHASRYGPALTQLIELGRSLSAMEFQRLVLTRMRFCGALNAVFEDVDIVLMPALYKAAPTLDDIEDERRHRDSRPPLVRFSAPTDYSGHPALTLPVGVTDAGVPFGAQLIGRHFEEDVVLRAGHALQCETDWHLRRPPL